MYKRQQLLEAGVHLGHKTLRWNPKMKKYIFGKRDSIHIIDLTQTLELINVALEKVYKVISENGKIVIPRHDKVIRPDNRFEIQVYIRAHTPELSLDTFRNITIEPNDSWLDYPYQNP